MRIGTWNVEYARGAEKNRRRLHRLLEANVDVWVLTETHDDLDLGQGYTCVTTAPRARRGPRARWTAIWSRFAVERTVAVEDDHRTVAALVASPLGPMLVYGTVLPWHSDVGPNGDAKTWAELHRVIPRQAREWTRLRQDHQGIAMCVAGDFNVNLGGPHYYGTKEAREMLRAGLKHAGLACVTETERVPAGMLRHPNIDHVCLDERLAERATVVTAWEGADVDGVRLSDHSALVVEVACSSMAAGK